MTNKRVLALIVILVVVFSLTSCKTDTAQMETVGIVENKEIESTNPTQEVQFCAGWVINQEGTSCDMPLNVKNAFTFATERIVEIKFTPLVFVSFKEESDKNSFRILTQIQPSGKESTDENFNCKKELLDLIEAEDCIKNNSKLCILTISSESEEFYIEAIEEVNLDSYDANTEARVDSRSQLLGEGWLQNTDHFPALIPLEATMAFDDVIAKEEIAYELISLIAHYEEEHGITRYAVACYKGNYPNLEMEIMIICIENDAKGQKTITVNLI